MKQFIFVDTLQEIVFKTLSLINSPYPSTILDKSSTSYARTVFNVCPNVYFLTPQEKNHISDTVNQLNEIVKSHEYFLILLCYTS